MGDNSALILFALGVYGLTILVAVFYLRDKYPFKYSIGILLCVLSPALGHLYVKSKYNWAPVIIFGTLSSGASSGSTNDFLGAWFLFAAISSSAMCSRISSAKKLPPSPRKVISEADKRKWNIPDTQTPEGKDTNINNKSIEVKFNRNEIVMGSLAILALLVFIAYLYINRKTI